MFEYNIIVSKQKYLTMHILFFLPWIWLPQMQDGQTNLESHYNVQLKPFELLNGRPGVSKTLMGILTNTIIIISLGGLSPTPRVSRFGVTYGVFPSPLDWM